MPLPQLQTYPGIETPRPADAMMKAQTMKNEMARTGIAQQNADTAQKYLGLAGKELGLKKEVHETNKNSKKLDNLIKYMPTLTREEWKPFRDHIKDIDPNLAAILPENVDNLTDEEWNDTVGKITYGAENFAKMKQKEYDKTIELIKEQMKEKHDIDLENIKQKNRLQLADKNAALKDTKSEKATAYTTPMNQILKEYGGGAGMKITTNPDGTMSFSQGGEKAYQDMAEKAKTDPKAKRDLATYEVLKGKLLATTGTDAVEASTQKRLIFQDGKFIEK